MKLSPKSIFVFTAAFGALLSFARTSAAAQPPSGEPLPSPVATGSQPIRLAAGMIFTEGCTSDKDGDVYFVDQDNNRILKYSFDNTSDDPTNGKLEVFLQPSNHANGMTFDNHGNLITCADEKNELWLIHAPFPPLPATAIVPKMLTPPQPGAEVAPKPEGLKPSDLKIDVLIKDDQGKPLNGPNDVFVIPKGPQAGGMYLTDPLYPRKWWTNRLGGSGMQQPGRYVYFLSPDHQTLTPVITDFNMPNGIIGTSNGKKLYVSDIDGRKTWSYTINDDGTLKDKTLFCNVGSDGMTIDDEGYLYITSGGVKIFDKDGQQVALFRMQAANVCFAGKDKNILFICAGKEIYALRMRTHGVGPQ